MILPQAAASTLAPSVNTVGSRSASVDKAGSGNSQKNGATGETSFRSLFAAGLSDESESAAGHSHTGSKTENSSTHKDGSSSDDQNQQNSGIPFVPAAAQDPILLALFSLTPAQVATSDTTIPDTSTQQQNSGTVTAATATALPQIGTGINVLTMPAALIASPVEMNLPLTAAQQAPAQTISDQQTPDPKTVDQKTADQTTVQDALPIVNAATAANENASIDGSSAAATIQAADVTNARPNGTAAMQPVFTLAIRPQPGTQSVPTQQPIISTSQTVTQNSLGQNSSAANSSTQSQPNIPQQSIDVQTTSNVRAANTPVLYQTSSATAASNSSSTAPASGMSANNAADTSAAITSAAPTTKGDTTTGFGSDGKPSDGQAGDRQAMAATIVESTVPAGPAGASQTQFNAPHAQPVTEDVNTQNAAGTHGTGTVTDLKLQIDGGSNQHVDVRLVQQADGLRMSVRSNDPMLAQSLRDHAPELTAKLEQHHYETEMLLQKGNDSQPLNLANTRANLQQEFSGRQQGSGGQSNPQNGQNERQKQQPKDEDDLFSALLGLRR